MFIKMKIKQNFTSGKLKSKPSPSLFPFLIINFLEKKNTVKNLVLTLLVFCMYINMFINFHININMLMYISHQQGACYDICLVYTDFFNLSNTQKLTLSILMTPSVNLCINYNLINHIPFDAVQIVSRFTAIMINVNNIHQRCVSIILKAFP